MPPVSSRPPSATRPRPAVRLALAMPAALLASVLVAALDFGVACAGASADPAAEPAARAARAPTAAPAATAAPAGPPVPAGDYRLDAAHSSLLFRVNHLGFTRYVGRFTKFDAKLAFDPARPARSRLDVHVDADSLDADNAPPGFLDTLRGDAWLDTAKHPAITFRSTRVEPRDGGGLRVTGEFTLHGVSRPIVLEARYNGGYAGHPMDPNARIGFSGTAKFRRSEFGIATGIPAAGSTLGVGDEVEVLVEAEFTGPPLARAAR